MKQIRAISFGPDSLDIAYVDESDLRLEGQVYLTHSLSLARSRFPDEVREIEEAAQDLVRDALAQWAQSLPYDLEQAYRDARRTDEDDDD
jgi:hypothetical protein